MQVSDVITSARNSLSDMDGSRWSDSRLFTLLNDVVRDLSLTTILFTQSKYLKLQQGIQQYKLDDTIQTLERVEFNRQPLEFATYSDMDRSYGTNWQIASSTEPKVIVYDKNVAGNFIVYPIPKEGFSDLTFANSDFGIITDITYDDIKLELVDNAPTDSADMSFYLKIFYIEKHKDVDSLGAELSPLISDDMTSMLSDFIVGKALLDNADTLSVRLGNQHLKMYTIAKSDFTKKRITNNVITRRHTHYNAGI